MAQAVPDFTLMLFLFILRFLLHEEDVVLLALGRHELVLEIAKEQLGTRHERSSLEVVDPMHSLAIVEVRPFERTLWRVGGTMLVDKRAFDDVLLQLANATKDAFRIA